MALEVLLKIRVEVGLWNMNMDKGRAGKVW